MLGELIEEPATNRSELCLNAALVCRKPRKFVTNFPDIDLGAHTKAYLAIFAPSAAISGTVIKTKYISFSTVVLLCGSANTCGKSLQKLNGLFVIQIEPESILENSNCLVRFA